MNLNEAKKILNNRGYVCEALKNEYKWIEIPVIYGEGGRGVLWNVKIKLDVDADKLVIDYKNIFFGKREDYVHSIWRNVRRDEHVPESATRSPSAAVAYIKKNPIWCNGKTEDVTIERFNKALEEKLKDLNNVRDKSIENRKKETVKNQFKDELVALLKKYDCKIGANCGSEYDPAYGSVWVEFKDGDLMLIDMESDKNYYFGEDKNG